MSNVLGILFVLYIIYAAVHLFLLAFHPGYRAWHQSRRHGSFRPSVRSLERRIDDLEDEIERLKRQAGE